MPSGNRKLQGAILDTTDRTKLQSKKGMIQKLLRHKDHDGHGS